MPVADTIVTTFEANVIPIDIPLLLGVDVLKKLRLIVNFYDKILVNVHEDWQLKLVYRHTSRDTKFTFLGPRAKYTVI